VRAGNDDLNGKSVEFLCALYVTSALKSLKAQNRQGRNVPTPNHRGQTERHSAFVIIWEFRINPRKRRAFRLAYGPDGEWARFFRKGEGYLGTELICDSHEPVRYITLDYWKSRKHYEIFKKQNRKMYEIIDQRCEALTTKEVEIGMFSRGIVSTASRKPKSEKLRKG
jgi:hypothetical protein